MVITCKTLVFISDHFISPSERLRELIFKSFLCYFIQQCYHFSLLVRKQRISVPVSLRHTCVPYSEQWDIGGGEQWDIGGGEQQDLPGQRLTSLPSLFLSRNPKKGRRHMWEALGPVHKGRTSCQYALGMSTLTDTFTLNALGLMSS